MANRRSRDRCQDLLHRADEEAEFRKMKGANSAPLATAPTPDASPSPAAK
jgi:hypothetical protein